VLRDIQNFALRLQERERERERERELAGNMVNDTIKLFRASSHFILEVELNRG